MLSESFEHVLKAAQLTASLTLAWKKFIKTKFFVAILRSPDDDPKNFQLSITRHPVDGKPVVIIAEVRDRIDQHQGDGVVAVSGADIVRRLGEQGGILIELSDGPFNVSRKRVAWLRSGIEVAEARVATRKVLEAAAPAAPLPVLSMQSGLFVSSASPAARKAQAAAAPPAPPAPARRSLEALAALHQPKPPQTLTAAYPPSHLRDSTPAQGALMAELAARAQELSRSLPVMLGVIGLAAAIAAYLVFAGDAPPPAPPAAAPAPKLRAAPAPAAPAPAASAPLAAMTRFAPPDNSFSVSVPGTPEELELTPEQVEQMGDLRMHQYKLVTESRIYTMQATDYGSRVPENIARAMDGMQESIVGKDGKLISSTAVPMRGASGREVRVQLPNGTLRAARFAFIGSKFCMVAIVAANGPQSGADIDAYLASFQLH
jgi:hypothetical protein